MKKNIKNYELINYFNATILIWGVMILYYNFKGLSFLQIALLQSAGSVMTIALEIPTGWLSDRYGYSLILKVSSISRIIALITLIIFNDFYLLFISEMFFSLAGSAQSGADTALFYESLIKSDKKEEYTNIKGKIRGRGSLIRIGTRLIAPVMFAYSPKLPFIISLFIYIVITALTMRYTDPSKPIMKTKVKEKNNEKNKVVKDRILEIIIKNKTFILYSLLSAFVLVSVSNYSQYLGPFLEERGLNIKWLGVVMASASLGDYLGTKSIKYLKTKNKEKVLLILAAFIFIFIFSGGVRKTILGGAIAYFGINVIYSPFSILLGESINEVISNKYRATLLSISNQFDEIFFVLIDPIIGLSIDILGFGLSYVYLGTVSTFLLIIVSILIKKYRRGVKYGKEIKL